MRAERSTNRLSASGSPGLGPLQNFYVLEPNLCPYLPGRTERKLLTEISGPDARQRYDLLSRAGFRRSHRFAYRPACANCSACVPVRVGVEAFQAGRSLRRIQRANADLTASMAPAKASPEQYALFRHYIESRHGDGQMTGMTEQEDRAMVEASDIDTRLAEFRAPDGTLLAVCLLDWLSDGPSAVYSFFDPEQSRRSLGTFVVLWLIEAAREAGAAHVYLGYWIEGSRKMTYKARFRPLEALIGTAWTALGR